MLTEINNISFAQWEANLKFEINMLVKQINELKERIYNIEQHLYGTRFHEDTSFKPDENLLRQCADD